MPCSKPHFNKVVGRQSNPTDFRPISLSFFLLKTLERLIDIHVRLTINSSLLSDAQHAYRKGRSTDTALHSLVFSIERGFRNKEYSLAAFLDKKANGYYWRSNWTGNWAAHSGTHTHHAYQQIKVLHYGIGPLDQECQQRNLTRGCTLTSSMCYSGQQTTITSRRGGH